jgi:hypothetical protein
MGGRFPAVSTTCGRDSGLDFDVCMCVCMYIPVSLICWSTCTCMYLVFWRSMLFDIGLGSGLETAWVRLRRDREVEIVYPGEGVEGSAHAVIDQCYQAFLEETREDTR